MPEPPIPWEQRDNETPKAYAAFCAYRDLGAEHRSQSRVCSDLGKDPSLIKGWSTRHEWVMRVRAFDQDLERKKRDAYLQETIAMGRRQAAQAQGLQTAAFAYCNAILRKLRDDPKAADDLQMLSFAELADLLRVAGHVWLPAMRAERIARGEPTEAVGPTLEPEPDALLTAEEQLAGVLAAWEEAGIDPRALFELEP